MIPILSGIIAGHGPGLSTRKAFWMSLTYVLAMSLTYAIAGLLAGLGGANLQAAFQDPSILSLFALVFVALALSMFGFYDLQLPSQPPDPDRRLSQRQQRRAPDWRRHHGRPFSPDRGSLRGATPGGGPHLHRSVRRCPPRLRRPLRHGPGHGGAAAGDRHLGGQAAASGRRLDGGRQGGLLASPCSGSPSSSSNACWPPVSPCCWGALLICSATYMGALHHLPPEASGWRKLWKGLGLVTLVYGGLMLVGAAAGGKDTLQPLRGFELRARGRGRHRRPSREFQGHQGTGGPASR